MDSSLQAFLSIGIVGTALSLTIQYIKMKADINGSTAKAMVVALSVFVGCFVFLLSKYAIWESILGVLAAASTVYALLFSDIRKANNDS